MIGSLQPITYKIGHLNFPSRCFVAIVALALCSASAADLPADSGVTPVNGGKALPLLTEAAAIRALPRDEAVRHSPVRVTGVVTFHDAQSGELFVQDATAGIYISLAE